MAANSFPVKPAAGESGPAALHDRPAVSIQPWNDPVRLDLNTQDNSSKAARGRKVRGRAKSTRGRAAVVLRRGGLALLALALLPVVLTLLSLLPFVHPVSTLLVRDMVMLRAYERHWVDIEDIQPLLVHSVIMSEDGQFCTHGGIDWGALSSVIDDALSGEPSRGASTISMQTVKNLFLWQGRSFVRKALEVPLAIGFDFVVPKRRTMEIYLNIVEWAPGIYGAEAASLYHFGVAAADLSRRQAALLAVTLPNPHERDPAKPSAGLNRLADIIEKRARQAGGHVGCVE
jgi:monofunctional biosynthetic peptidoglycan transglycosylase